LKADIAQAGKAIGQQTGQLRNGGSIQDWEQRTVLFFTASVPALGLGQPPVQSVWRGLFSHGWGTRARSRNAEHYTGMFEIYKQIEQWGCSLEALIAVIMKDSILWDITSWYLLSVSPWSLAWYTPEAWRWMRFLPPKDRLIFTGQRCVISQKTELFRWYVCPLRYLRIETKAWCLWTYLIGICWSVEIGGTQESYWRPSALKDDAHCWSWNLWTTSGAEEHLSASFTLATHPLLAAIYSILHFPQILFP
jgi:hypothetical protein